MRLITFSLRGAGSPRIGVRVARQVLDLAAAAGVSGEPAPPTSMRELLAAGDPAMRQVREFSAEAHADRAGFATALVDKVNDLRDDALRARLGEKARKVVLGRTWPAVCNELVGHYEAVTGRLAQAA